MLSISLHLGYTIIEADCKLTYSRIVDN